MTWLPGDVTLSPIILKSLDGQRQADISNQVVSIDLYESILSPVMKASIRILDSIDLQTSFPIIGEEVVELEWNTLASAKPCRINLVVSTVEEMRIDVSNRSKTYTLACISAEAYTAQSQQVSRTYELPSADIIKNLVTQYLQTQKPLYFDSTRGIDQVQLVNLRPFEAIDKIRQRAISTRYQSSSFCFYENTRGYHFYTVEGLFDRGRKEVGDRVFFYDTNTAEDQRTAQYRNLIAYEHVNTGSTLQAVADGGLRNEVTSYDIVTGALQTTRYGNEDYEAVDEAANPLHTSSFTGKYGNTVSQTYFTPIDSSLPEYDLPGKIAYLQGFVQRIVSNLLHVHIYGDATISVGDVIELRLPNATGTDQMAENRLLSGNYLVAKCRHMIQNGNLKNYTQSLELIKGSYIGRI